MVFTAGSLPPSPQSFWHYVARRELYSLSKAILSVESGLGRRREAFAVRQLTSATATVATTGASATAPEVRSRHARRWPEVLGSLVSLRNGLIALLTFEGLPVQRALRGLGVSCTCLRRDATE